MDNIENWIYLILGAIYFLSKLRKKNKPPTPELEDKESTTSKKVKTFEELLGELTGFSKVERTEDEDVKVLMDEKSPDGEVPNFVSDKTTIPNPASKDEKIVQDAKLTFPNVPPLAKDENFKEYSIKDSQVKPQQITASEIKNELKSTKGVKKALIFSEILKRKY